MKLHISFRRTFCSLAIHKHAAAWLLAAASKYASVRICEAWIIALMRWGDLVFRRTTSLKSRKYVNGSWVLVVRRFSRQTFRFSWEGLLRFGLTTMEINLGSYEKVNVDGNFLVQRSLCARALLYGQACDKGLGGELSDFLFPPCLQFVIHNAYF